MCHHESIYSVNDRQVCVLETEKKKERKKKRWKKGATLPKTLHCYILCRVEENVLDQIYTPQMDNATQTHTIPSLCFIIYSFPKWNLQLHATAVTALFMCVRVLRTCYGISEPWPSLWGVCWTLQRKRKMIRSSVSGEISCHSSRPSGSAASCLLLHWCVVLRGFGLWLHRNRSTSCDG